MILWKIRPAGGAAPFDGALVRLDFLGENPEQGGHGNLVFPDERDLVAFVDPEGHPVEHLDTVHRLADTLYREDLFAGLAVHLEADKGIAPGGGGHFVHRQLFEQLFAGGSLTGFGLVGRKTLDEALQLPDLVLFFLVLVAQYPLHQLAGLVPEVVVADIDFDFVVIHVHNMGADVVEKMPVVGDDDDGAHIVHQKILQPADGSDVQMVGRLVEQDDVRLAEQRLREQDLDLFLVA